MRRLMVPLLALLAACGGPPAAVPIATGTPCAFCRMTIADVHLAGEVVAPGEEPRQYDDIGCLLNDLRQRPAPAGGRAFVSDYRSGVLVPADTAVYTRVHSLATPMGSHLVAHAAADARELDVRVLGGDRLAASDLFGAALAPGGPDGK